MVNFNKDVIDASNNNLVVVDFFANWCGPCKVLGPILSNLEKDMRFKLVKIDVEEESELASEFGVMSIPTILVYKNGVIVDEFTGALPESTLKERFSKHQ